MSSTEVRLNRSVPRPSPLPSSSPLRRSNTAQFEEAVGLVEETAARLFDMDSRVHSVGVGTDAAGRPIYRAVRNAKKIVAQGSKLGPKLTIAVAKEFPFPVQFVSAEHDPEPLFRLPLTSVAAAGTASVPEQKSRRPLVSGLQIQNFDDDDRQGVFTKGFMIVGTIGCFVRKKSGTAAFILSNNHVVAGENRGQSNDRILQSGSTTFDATDLVANLRDFVPIEFSPSNATVKDGTVVFNDVDAGIARLAGGVTGRNAYLPIRKGFRAPTKFGTAQDQALVSKVGRTTGATRGRVTALATIVGPVDYDGQPAWFRNSIEIEGLDGSQFSDSGDSGSAIVNEKGEVVGLLYAGNGSQTDACPIASVVAALGIKPF